MFKENNTRRYRQNMLLPKYKQEPRTRDFSLTSLIKEIIHTAINYW